ncbi:23S rRNA (adenine(2503)-C(2))-methyltransferase RlmN [Candidatus Methylacidithermus pantelleriae]|uniref:Probable dual-specificity RNA methyltransferase RlmN n=1 Tax=Candidatus Methylacidithermus pantelleriae TaxID=2744239 RepID=A0A8J2BWQ3_9BACT|nr:23S rRNA (adenine(2503)-C(2))-methyltransferase RlmN [Candidatus Methylacidithermus pantelleriae]CAF0705231.1 putative dual-specificity RNA methyltransferase RlmN [Candidatus Methylacidithermus pantelleriae]
MESILDRPIEEWDLGPEPLYRRSQICHWIFGRRVTDFSQMTSLPWELRRRLSEQYSVHTLSLETRRVAPDGTEKFLWRLSDGQLLESVLIPASEGRDGMRAKRWTLCISTQVGCAYGCRFCASGLMGWKRNLTPGEIVGQVLAAQEHSRLPMGNLVFMGMGEPLANFDALQVALSYLCSPWGLGIGARRITISTVGLVPKIWQLAEDPRAFRLAISLHAPNDALRSKLMPIARKYSLQELLEACIAYVRNKGPCLTFEYILLEHVNDYPDHARELSALARRAGAKLNLIPYNPVQGLPWKRPRPTRLECFRDVLARSGCEVTVRQPKGDMIEAACGQLRLVSLVGGGYVEAQQDKCRIPTAGDRQGLQSAAEHKPFDRSMSK